jgi:hypothetical protein
LPEPVGREWVDVAACPPVAENHSWGLIDVTFILFFPALLPAAERSS